MLCVIRVCLSGSVVVWCSKADLHPLIEGISITAHKTAQIALYLDKTGVTIGVPRIMLGKEHPQVFFVLSSGCFDG